VATLSSLLFHLSGTLLRLASNLVPSLHSLLLSPHFLSLARSDSLVPPCLATQPPLRSLAMVLPSLVTPTPQPPVPLSACHLVVLRSQEPVTTAINLVTVRLSVLTLWRQRPMLDVTSRRSCCFFS
jgi:hypothetical protein